MCDYDCTDDDYEDRLEDYLEDEANEDEVDEAEAREDLEWSMHWAALAKLPTERPYPIKPPCVLKWESTMQRIRPLYVSGVLDSGSSHEDVVSCLYQRGMILIHDQFALLRVLQATSWSMYGGFITS